MSSALTAAKLRSADRIPARGAKIAPDPSAHGLKKEGLLVPLVPLMKGEKMKVIEAIISPVKLDEVKAALQKMGIERITVRHFINNGRKRSKVMIDKSTEYMVGLLTKIRVEIIAADELVGRVIETIGNVARTERNGDCRIYIRPFSEAV
jgi:nitrogen regulatory protein PII